MEIKDTFESGVEAAKAVVKARISHPDFGGCDPETCGYTCFDLSHLINAIDAETDMVWRKHEKQTAVSKPQTAPVQHGQDTVEAS